MLRLMLNNSDHNYYYDVLGNGVLHITTFKSNEPPYWTIGLSQIKLTSSFVQYITLKQLLKWIYYTSTMKI